MVAGQCELIADGTAAKLRTYIDGVVSGDIIVSSLVRASVDRHLRDLVRQRTDDFPYYFDERHAIKVCQFFPLLIRHSIGKFQGHSFELEPWQVFMVCMVFGWKKCSDDTRRFRKWFCSLGRKNGKSSLAAAVAFYMSMADINPNTGKPESVAQSVLSATKKEQVIKVIYQEMQRMRHSSPTLSKMSRNINQQFSFPHNDGQVICVGSDKPFDGLNPSFNVNDELHAWREHHREFYNTMTTGSGGRDQPLQLIVTTAGDDKSHLWLEEYTYCAGVCRGEIHDESVFAFIAEVDPDDDPLDEANWPKANPNLDVSVSRDYLRQQALEASQSKIKLNKFTRYHGNRLVTSTEKAFDLEAWDRCSAAVGEWGVADAVGCGADLGARDDFAAEAYCARFPIGERDGQPVYRYEVRVQAYISEETERDLSKQPFCEWVYRDLIKKSKYPLADLRESIAEQCQNYGANSVAYDPYNAQQLAEELTREGLTPIRMAQNHTMFNEPIRDFLQAIKEGRVSHGGNPLLRWCVNNAVVYRDRKDLWMFDKKSSSEKIDPIVSVVMAFRVCCLAPARATGSLYL